MSIRIGPLGANLGIPFAVQMRGMCYVVLMFILVTFEGPLGHSNSVSEFLPQLPFLGPPLLVRGVLTWDTKGGPYARMMATMALVSSLSSSPLQQNGALRATPALRPRRGAASRANGRWYREATPCRPRN